ncbi:hypothetical protein [Actinosynnema pretiosum]|nr:hypothetical protein [Actinosynnema pretiosum]
MGGISGPGAPDAPVASTGRISLVGGAIGALLWGVPWVVLVAR